MAIQLNLEKVTFTEAGLSKDGQRLFVPHQAYEVPSEVEPKKVLGPQHGEFNASYDEFHILRPGLNNQGPVRFINKQKRSQ
jgi:hypothetical protein